LKIKRMDYKKDLAERLAELKRLKDFLLVKMKIF
jgi:hypothetical protein